ncbi:MAG: hypothetical protein L0338_30535 [Acidobacteria bacterium]|nr:hypothetical protein [Acidobacteriota bacterium]
MVTDQVELLDPIVRQRIDSLSLSRFVPEKPVLTLEQEYFFSCESTRVIAAFLANFTTLLPETMQKTKTITPGPLRVGSRLIATPMYLTRPLVVVEVVHLTESEMSYAYLEDGPLIGRNTMRFVPSLAGTAAVVRLRYQLNGFLPAMGWHLLGGRRFHQKLIAVGFRNLERLLAGPS